MEALSLWEKILAIGAAGFIVLIFLSAFIMDMVENWRHWLIYLGLIAVGVTVILVFQ